MSVSELRHGTELSEPEAVELMTTHGIEAIRVHPNCVDVTLKGGGVIALYVAGSMMGTIRFERWDGGALTDEEYDRSDGHA